MFFSENKGFFWACEMQKDKVHDHAEKWLFFGAIIWQYGMQIPEFFFVLIIIWLYKLLFYQVI